MLSNGNPFHVAASDTRKVHRNTRCPTPQQPGHRDAYQTCLVSHFIRFWTHCAMGSSLSPCYMNQLFFSSFLLTASVRNSAFSYSKSVQVAACYELSIHLNFVFFFIIVKNLFLVTKLTVFPSPVPHKSRNGCCKEDY